MKIAIIGGAGRSGQLLIDRALASGYEVTTFVRDRSKIAIQHDRLKIVEGDVRDLDRVNAAIQNQAAVISVLGQTRPPTKELLTIGVGNILKAMQQNNVTRLVYLTGAGVRSEKDSAPPIAAKVMMFLLKKMAADVLQDSEQAAELIKRSDREWIIVRVPRLSDDPAKGSVRSGFDRPGFAAISRSDAAEFLLKQLIDPTYIDEMPFISY